MCIRDRIIDAMDILYSNKVDGFCLVSSDSDFTRLATRLKEAGMQVIGIGEKKTPNPFIVACDRFIYIEILKKKSVEKIESNKDELIEVGSEVINFGNKLITEAINLGASDIHIECFRDSAQVRYRVDGILKQMEKYSKFLFENYNAVVARIKIISKLDIAERRVPQDGASTFKSDTKEIDLRISILPTKNNERIVMRILNKDAGDKALSELGFDNKDLEKLLKAITSPQGMILVTGPTGSGKTTTLYSLSLIHI